MISSAVLRSAFLFLLLCALPKVASAQITAELICDGSGIFSGSTFTIRAVSAGLEHGLNYTESLDLPEGFRSITRLNGPFTNDADSRLKVFVVSVDKLVPAGTYTVSYTIRSENGQGSTAQCKVEIAPREELELALINGEYNIYPAGETAKLRVIARNTGNAPIQAELDVYIGNVGHLSNRATRVTIAPGETVERTFDVTWRNETTFLYDQSVFVTAYSGDGDQRRIIGSTSKTISVAPDAPDGFSKWWKVPSQIELFAVSDGDTSDMFVELKGDGVWDDGSKHGLSWFVRTPSSGVRGGLHTEDRYSLRFYGPEYEVLVGDHTFDLSKLTQRYYFGRGIAMRYFPEDSGLELKVLGHSESYSFEEEDRYGGSVKLIDSGTGSFVKANILRRDLHYSSRFLDPGNTLFSLDSQLALTDSIDLFWEIARSRNDVSEPGGAYRIGSRGTLFDKVRYTVDAVEADETFFGFYTDSRHYEASAGADLIEDVSFRSSWSYADVNVSESAGRPRTVGHYLTAGPTWNYSDAWSFSIEGVDFYRRHKSDGPDYDFEQESVRLQATHYRGRLSLTASLELGQQHNNILDASEDLTIYGLRARYGLSRMLSLDARAEYGQDRFNEFPATSLRLNGGVRFRPTNALQMDLRGGWTEYKDVSAREQIHLTGSISYKFKNNHTVRAGVRWMQGKRRNLFNPGQQYTNDSKYYYVSYAIPFGAPVGLRSNTGSISGVIGIPLADGSLKGVGGVVLSIEGRQAVTDSSGKFVFPHMQPGVYVMRLDQSSIGSSMVAAIPEPSLVEVETGKETVLEIPIYKAAVLSGVVKTRQVAAAPRLDGLIPASVEPVADFTGMFVLVKGPLGEQLIPLDASGSFTVYGLTPGQWSANVVDFAIPEGFKAPPEPSILNVKEGEVIDLTVELLPVMKRMRIIDEGSLSRY